MWPDTDPRPNVEGDPQHGGGEKSLQEMRIKGQMPKKREVPITGIVCLVIVLLDPT